MTSPDDDHIGLCGHCFQDFCLFRDTDIGFAIGRVIVRRQRNTALGFVGQIPAVFACQDIGPTGFGGQTLTRCDAVTKAQYVQTV